jgi:hypothetical protein
VHSNQRHTFTRNSPTERGYLREEILLQLFGAKSQPFSRAEVLRLRRWTTELDAESTHNTLPSSHPTFLTNWPIFLFNLFPIYHSFILIVAMPATFLETLRQQACAAGISSFTASDDPTPENLTWILSTLRRDTDPTLRTHMLTDPSNVYQWLCFWNGQLCIFTRPTLVMNYQGLGVMIGSMSDEIRAPVPVSIPAAWFYGCFASLVKTCDVATYNLLTPWKAQFLWRALNGSHPVWPDSSLPVPLKTSCSIRRLRLCPSSSNFRKAL